MKPLYLDFHRPRHVIPWLGLLLITAGVVALLTVMTELDVVTQQRLQLQQREDDIALQLKRGQQQQQNQLASSPTTNKQIELRTQQQLSPQQQLHTLEQHWAPDVAFMRLDLDTSEKNVKLDIEARNLDELLLFIDRLEADSGVDLVTLARSGGKPGDQHEPVTATLEISWHKAPARKPLHDDPASAGGKASAMSTGNGTASQPIASSGASR